MSRKRKTRHSVCVQISKWRQQRRQKACEPTAGLATNTAIIANVIHQRERGGRATTLRHLHKVSNLSQSDALKAVADLERTGMAVVHHNTNDAFESVITLSETMRGQLDNNSRRDAA